MFGIFKRDPAKALKKEYASKLEQARDLQRKGDLVGAAQKTSEAETVLKQLDNLEAQQKAKS